MAFEDDRSHYKTFGKRSALSVELPLRVLDRDLRHAIPTTVLCIPFGALEPADQIDAGLRTQPNHVFPEQLLLESSEQFVVPAALGLYNGGNRVKPLAILPPANGIDQDIGALPDRRARRTANLHLAIGENSGSTQFSLEEARDDVRQGVLINRPENIFTPLPVPQVPDGV